ncbi:divergent polysaccharide deacteylase family protein [Rhodovulum euryhalinum]|uniref:Divergent polysaccharide deacetylase n=1 Tax=Rhodovulum euryhalinum TaxID=35805 RepID=A0A4R2KIZ9_9RHOB|nr:divergent polysaccharide deacetylase family protein [Rhodovulum euryhalinum]TCO72387.1 hypothetical protein EV655_10474 [Rhodovulum euryhalinum]
MGRGLFSGIVWGIFVTGLSLVALALVVPAPTGPSLPGEAPAPQLAARPEAPAAQAPDPAAAPPEPASRPVPAPAPEAAPATDIELPPGSEFNRPPPEREASLPGAEPEPQGAPPVRGPEAAGALAEAPLPDTAPAAAPEPVTTGPDGLAPPLSAEPPPDLAADETYQPPSGTSGPAALRTGPVPAAPRPADVPAAERAEAWEQPEPAMPQAAAPVDAPAPHGGALPRVRPLPGTPGAAPIPPEPEAEAAMPAADDAEQAPRADGALRIPAPGGGTAVPDIRIGRLPTAADDAMAPAPEAEPAAPPPESPESAAAEPGEAAPEQGLGALARNAVPFQPDPGRPLFSVILIDAGEQGLDRETLMTFSFPVTFAVDPMRPDAAETVAAYRAAGYEVVLLAAGLPEGAVPSDLEVALAARETLLGQTVAVMDVQRGGFQDDRALTAQMVDFAKASGHGIVTYDRGLNAAARLAGQAGVPQATVFRILDEDRPNAPTIRRILDRAVFKARQDGYVMMVGHSYSDTVTALYSWALEAEAEAVELAPASAVLRRR